MNRCDICLEPDCSKANCHCDSCTKATQCPKYLRPTIRITTKCTQKCDHCCFSCSPSEEKMMTPETATKIAEFLKNNEILSLNVMGGEFFCNPDWFTIIEQFLNTGSIVRLVTNSDWYANDSVKEKLAILNTNAKGRLYLSLSYDKWHTNIGVKAAENYLKEQGIPYTLESEEQASDMSLVPVGRSEFNYSFGLYGMLACYCHNPEHQYSFMIDEEGEIYKCSFGVLCYANIRDYTDGGFNARFKEFNKRFYAIFIPSCSHCIRAFSTRKYPKTMH